MMIIILFIVHIARNVQSALFLVPYLKKAPGVTHKKCYVLFNNRIIIIKKRHRIVKTNKDKKWTDTNKIKY